jgi:diguanylate cyclase (GGDEF)-like protein
MPDPEPDKVRKIALDEARRVAIESEIGRIEKSDQSGLPSIVFIDLDRFTALNKYYGESVCNRVLEVIEELLAVCCPSDFQTRIGGDQFLMCVKGTSASEVRERAQDCIDAIRNYHWPMIAPNLYVTASAGTALYKGNEDVGRWIFRAIHGSINAKRSGGNVLKEGPIGVSVQQRGNYVDLLS